jgi:hypothetical protein
MFACPYVKGKVMPVQAVEALRVARSWGSHIFRYWANKWRQICQPYAPAALYSLVLISVRGWVDSRAIVRLEELGKLKISTSSRTRTDDLPACSIVSQPTLLPRAPLFLMWQNHVFYYHLATVMFETTATTGFHFIASRFTEILTEIYVFSSLVSVFCCTMQQGRRNLTSQFNLFLETFNYSDNCIRICI